MTEHHMPPERDLPAARHAKLKEDLMAQIERDLTTKRQAANVVTRRRWRRLGLTAAALAAGVALASSLVLTDQDSAEANTAERTEDGGIIITIREAKHPKDLERRLNDLGVPAIVDFLDSGFRCEDEGRSTGWVQEAPDGEMLEWVHRSDDEWQMVFHPELLRDGETTVFEFQIDEHGDEMAVNVMLARSTEPVGPCEPVPSASIVDAEGGIAGG